MNLVQMLVRAARVHPERPAVWLGGQPLLDYRALADRAARLAGHLRGGLGLQPGDRVALVMSNHVAYLELLQAAWWAGLAVVPVNAKLHPGEVEFILRDAGAAALFTTADLAAGLRPMAAGVPTLRQLLVAGSRTTRPRWPRPRGRPSTARPTTWRGCSTPRAPPAGPRA